MTQAPFDFDMHVSILPVAGARNSDPETSHLAGQNLDLKGEHRIKALLALDDGDKLSDFDLEKETGIAQTSIGVRRGELCKAGLVEDSGERGKSPRGASVILWRCTERGHQIAAQIRERMRDERN